MLPVKRLSVLGCSARQLLARKSSSLLQEDISLNLPIMQKTQPIIGIETCFYTLHQILWIGILKDNHLYLISFLLGFILLPTIVGQNHYVDKQWSLLILFSSKQKIIPLLIVHKILGLLWNFGMESIACAEFCGGFFPT